MIVLKPKTLKHAATLISWHAYRIRILGDFKQCHAKKTTSPRVDGYSHEH